MKRVRQISTELMYSRPDERRPFVGSSLESSILRVVAGRIDLGRADPVNIWGDDERLVPIELRRPPSPAYGQPDSVNRPCSVSQRTSQSGTCAPSDSASTASIAARHSASTDSNALEPPMPVVRDLSPASALAGLARAYVAAQQTRAYAVPGYSHVHLPPAASVSRPEQSAGSQLVQRPGPPKLLCGKALAAALARHPHLTLAAHNRSPGLNAHKLDLVIFRIPCAPAVPGALLDPTVMTAPFSMARSVPAYLEPVIGTRDVYNYLSGDLAHLRSCGGSPTTVRVPLALPGLSDGEAERPMLFIPDSLAGAAYGRGDAKAIRGGGWIISVRRWEGRLHGGARRWRNLDD
jgi:hypothetical protein